MRTSKLPFVAALSLAAIFVVACGDDNKNQAAQALNPADVMWIKQERMRAMYGSTVTSISTQTNTVIIQNTTTVNTGSTGGSQ